MYLFRRLKCVHVYECVSHGRQWFYSLHMTTDYRYTLRDLQPSFKNRNEQYPDWWIRGAGVPYPCGVNECLVNDIDGRSAKVGSSVVVVREQQHHKNISGGREFLIPSRLLYGAIPEALLESYLFWQDESLVPQETHPDDYSKLCRDYKRLRGYPKDEEDEHMIIVEFLSTGDWTTYVPPTKEQVNCKDTIQATGFPGRTVKVIRRLKGTCEEDFRVRTKVASALESFQLLVEPQKKKKTELDLTELASPATDLKFKMDSEVCLVY